MTGKWWRWAAVTIAALAAAFWIWFGVGSAAQEGEGPGNWLAHLLVPGGVLAATLLLAMRWERVGGVLLVIEGSAALVAYPLIAGGRFPSGTIVFVLLTLALPPVAAGLLFLADWRATRQVRA